MATVSAHAVANQFIGLADAHGRPLTNMQLQKLVFFAHGYTLALLGRPLYYHNTHAWQWGPVIPKLYKPLQKYGSSIVTAPVPVPDDDAGGEIEQEEKDIIAAVWEAYGKHSGGELSAITHKTGSPWDVTWRQAQFSVIPNDVITAYYQKLLSAP